MTAEYDCSGQWGGGGGAYVPSNTDYFNFYYKWGGGHGPPGDTHGEVGGAIGHINLLP